MHPTFSAFLLCVSLSKISLFFLERTSVTEFRDDPKSRTIFLEILNSITLTKALFFRIRSQLQVTRGRLFEGMEPGSAGRKPEGPQSSELGPPWAGDASLGGSQDPSHGSGALGSISLENLDFMGL